DRDPHDTHIHLRGPTAMTYMTITYLPSADAAVERLARLDDAGTPIGPVLVAAIDGEPCAAVPARGGQVVANPFLATPEALALLELRASQIRATAPRQRATLRAPRGILGY